MKAWLFPLTLAAGIGLGASEDFSTARLKAIPILDGGRVKPLDTYARVTLLQFSSKSTYDKKPATDWLARVLLTPKAAGNDMVFRINNHDVVYTLGLEPAANNRYSFSQLAPAIGKISEQASSAAKVDEKKRTPVETEFIRLANNMSTYLGLMNSFLFTSSHADFRITDPKIAERLGLEARETPYSFMAIRGRMGQLAAVVQPLLGESARDPSTWTAEETNSYQLFQNFTSWGRHYRDYPIPIIPPGEKGTEAWSGPWALVAQPSDDPGVKAAVGSIVDLAAAYEAGEQEKFDRAAEALQGFLLQRGAGIVKPWRLKLEIFYNKLDAFYRTKVLYGLAILCSLLGMMAWRKWLYLPSLLLLAGGALLQGAGLGLRIAISGRSPVSNLFETFVFVAFIGAVLGIILEAFNRKGFGTLVGAITGFLILLLSGRYETDGDTIGVLVAVLNSNFWLSTHVITISLGYAGFCMAGVIGHVYLIQALINRNAREKLENLARMTYAILAFGLIFSFIGTVLGGIWADQSWGRFWGWDPKENGALMIVLWGLILFHAKPAKMIGPQGMAVGAVLGIIVVMMAWFGINLLGVGLHSYGFTAGVANALAAYVAGEILFVGVAVYLIHRSAQRQLAA